MSKVAVVYWSSTGNTEDMAHAVVAGATAAGAEAKLIYCSDFDEDQVDSYTAIAFGCPATGTEQLDEGEFEPMFTSLEAKLNGKPIALFGSHSWGDGEWMRDWEELCRSYGANLVAGSVIAEETPDDEALEHCRELGRAVATLG